MWGSFPGFIHVYIVVPCQSLDFGGGLTSVAPPLPSQYSRIYPALDSLISRPLVGQSSDAKISRGTQLRIRFIQFASWKRLPG